jgi:hypothetical protein
MLEKELLTEVLRLCERYHQAAYHTSDSRKVMGPGIGFPDLVIAGKDVIFAELKSPGGSMSWKQTEWKYRLRAAKADCYLWRPSDLASGEIEAVLSANELRLYPDSSMTIKNIGRKD